MTGEASQPAVEVVEPGLLLTVQDLGRRGHEHLGVPRAGAADTRSLQIANRLVGNEPGAAALEATLLGPRLRALRPSMIAIAGADLAPTLLPSGRSLDRNRAHRLELGDELAFEEPGDSDRGCRVYIAIAGGIDVPVVLGSRSTSLVGGFGGLDGRGLRSGDVLAAFRRTESGPDRTATPAGEPTRPWQGSMRVLPGPAAKDPGGQDRLDALLETRWMVALASDRRGLRLDPNPDADRIGVPEGGGDLPSFGVVPGAIQLTPSGQPLILMPDAGVTGGYPVLAIVVTADLPALGQLVPGAPIRFAVTEASSNVE